MWQSMRFQLADEGLLVKFANHFISRIFERFFRSHFLKFYNEWRSYLCYYNNLVRVTFPIVFLKC